MRRARDLRDAHDREAAQTIATTLVPKIITITAKAGSEGKLFGSVTVGRRRRRRAASRPASSSSAASSTSEPIKTLGQHTRDGQAAHRRVVPDHRRDRLGVTKIGAWRCPQPHPQRSAVAHRSARSFHWRPTRSALRGWRPDGPAGRRFGDRRGDRDGEQRPRTRAAGSRPTTCRPRSPCSARVLLSRDAIGAVSEQGLRPDDFYRPAHQHIFDAVRALYSTGAPADTITVADELRRAGLLEQIGGTEALHALQNATPAISNAAHYARIVQDTALLRRLIHVAGDIAEMAYGEPDDVTKAVDEAESKVFKVAEDRVTDSTAAAQRVDQGR